MFGLSRTTSRVINLPRGLGFEIAVKSASCFPWPFSVSTFCFSHAFFRLPSEIEILILIPIDFLPWDSVLPFQAESFTLNQSITYLNNT